MIKQYDTTIQPRVGQAIGLGVTRIDAGSLALTFHYQEQIGLGLPTQQLPIALYMRG